MSLTFAELKERIIQEYDPDLLCDVLQVTTEELVIALEDKILDNIFIFEELDYDDE